MRASLADDAGILIDGYSRAAKRWFEGDFLGILSVTPAVLAGVSLARRDTRLVPRPRIVSWLGVAEVVSVVAVPVLAVQLLPTVDVLYVSLAPVAFVALRRAQPGASIAAAATIGALVTTLAITGEDFARRRVLVLLGALALSGMVAGLVAARRFGAVLRNERLGDAIERIDDIVVLASLSGAPRWWNRAAARFLLRSGDGSPAAIDEVMVGGADRLARHASDGAGWSGDEVLVDAGGTEVPVSVSMVPDVDDHGGVMGYALFARDITAARHDERRLREGALHDELTGLPNRALLVEHVAHACQRLRRSTRQSALLLLDIDRFGVVNDSLGRNAGDELLRALAVRLHSRVRAGDTLARLGGDEFVLLAEELDGFDAIVALADGLLDALREPFELASGDVVAVGSVGVVRIDPGHSPDELIRRADLAMYRAKAEGGARYAVYDGRLTTSADRRLLLETSLRRSLADRSVTLHYQPVVDLRTGGGLVFAEALLRVDSKGIGPVGPPEVVAVARETGLLRELGRLILDAALREAASWPSSTAVSVNLSSGQVLDGDLADVVEKTLRRQGFDPTRLIVEVSEDTFLADPRLGCRRAAPLPRPRGADRPRRLRVGLVVAGDVAVVADRHPQARPVPAHRVGGFTPEPGDHRRGARGGRGARRRGRRRGHRDRAAAGDLADAGVPARPGPSDRPTGTGRRPRRLAARRSPLTPDELRPAGAPVRGWRPRRTGRPSVRPARARRTPRTGGDRRARRRCRRPRPS